ncbi:MAG: alpha/beta fold hydrolase [Calditrichia bacterium]|nr:alpha/beta fold hydrolase [Calditrichia bacterium]
MIEYNNNKINVTEWGIENSNGNKPIIIGLHGLGFNGYSTFKNMGEFFSEKGYTFITFDFPGFGISPFMEGLTWDNFSEIINIIFKKCRYDNNSKIILIAHSMGGIMALSYIAKFPEKVLAYCSLEGNCLPGGGYLSKKFARMPDKRLVRFFELFVKQVEKDPGQQGLSFEYMISLKQTNAQTMKYYSDLLVNHVPQNLFQSASKLVEHKSYLYAPGSPEGDDLAKLYKNENYLVYAVQNALHDLINSQPDNTNNWLRKWIDDILN